MSKILMIDNYDSFTYNIVQYVAELGYEVHTVRNDLCTVEDALAMHPSHVIVGPGPCDPDQAGISLAVIGAFAGQVPVLGVCLGASSHWSVLWWTDCSRTSRHARKDKRNSSRWTGGLPWTSSASGADAVSFVGD